jgi:hypothetical protein
MLRKIISGGQTGADRAALDWAINHGIPHGGWCPKGCRAEDGTIEAHYCLIETPSEEYWQRTEWNVRDSDATVIFSIRRDLHGGTLLTLQLAKQYNRPMIHLCQEEEQANHARALRSFIEQFHIAVLNVAGPRSWDEPGIDQFVSNVLDQAFSSEETL